LIRPRTSLLPGSRRAGRRTPARSPCGTGQFVVGSLLDVCHVLLERRIGEPCVDLVGSQVRPMLMDPPQVSFGVTERATTMTLPA
jgi:hypothetical protein